MLKQGSKLQLLIFLCMYSVRAGFAPSPGNLPPELHACRWQLGPLIHNQRPCLISLQLLGEFLLSESVIRVDRMMKFNEHLLCMRWLVLLCQNPHFFPSSGIVSLECMGYLKICFIFHIFLELNICLRPSANSFWLSPRISKCVFILHAMLCVGVAEGWGL